MGVVTSAKTQRGLFLVLFAIISVALLAMLGLMVGSGFLASNRTLLQNAGNNTALAAIEGYSSTRSRDYFLRSCASRTRAERVLELNEVKGFELTGVRVNDLNFPAGTQIKTDTPMDATQHMRCSDEANPAPGTTAGSLTFGRWIEDQGGDPEHIIGEQDTGSPGCRTDGQLKYPCFLREATPNADTQVSAVRVDLTTAAEPPFFVPFAGQMANVTSRSFGVVVPRCFAGVVDLSYSSVIETHPLPASEFGLFGVRTLDQDANSLNGIQLCPSCGDPAGGLQGVCNSKSSNGPICSLVSGEYRCTADEPALFPGYQQLPPPARSFRQGGWERPWIPWRFQQLYPRFDPNLEPPFLGLPFIPLQFLQTNTSAAGNPDPIFLTHEKCDSDIDPLQSYTGMVWCNMWRGRNPLDDATDWSPGELNGCSLASPQMDRFRNQAETSSLAHFWSDYDPDPVAGYQPTRPLDWFPRPHQSPYGPLLVDRLITPPGVDGVVASAGPEPLSRYLAAMNAAFRLVSEQSAAGDRALVLGFAGDLMYRGDNPNARVGTPPDDKPFQVAVVPGIGMENEDGATQDFALLAQVTNPLSRGVFYWDSAAQEYRGAPAGDSTHSLAEYHPNFVDVGLVSRFVYANADNPTRAGDTNILKGILDARARLLNPNNGAGCGPGSLKSIVLFTDGVNTCAPKSDFAPFVSGGGANSWFNRLLAGPGTVTVENPDFFACKTGGATDFANFYQRYEDFLFGGPSFVADDSEPSGLLQALQQDRIAFSAIIDGPALGAIWNRVERPGSPGEYLRISELKTAPPAVKRQAFEFNSATRPGVFDDLGGDRNTRDANAYRRAGSDAYFRRPIDTLGRLAAESGGTLWPILPRCTSENVTGCPASGCYEVGSGGTSSPGAELLSSVWASNGNRVSCSPLNYSESEQAAYVMVDSIGQKPYSLREPVAGDIN